MRQKYEHEKPQPKRAHIFIWTDEKNDIIWRQVTPEKWEYVDPDRARSITYLAPESGIMFFIKTSKDWKITDIEHLVATQIQQCFPSFWASGRTLLTPLDPPITQSE